MLSIVWSIHYTMIMCVADVQKITVVIEVSQRLMDSLNVAQKVSRGRLQD